LSGLPKLSFSGIGIAGKIEGQRERLVERMTRIGQAVNHLRGNRMSTANNSEA
tara:strand:- start:2145 stop:2303 length:159 start_codon:yes stop_codon:yes gene_type:complete